VRPPRRVTMEQNSSPLARTGRRDGAIAKAPAGHARTSFCARTRVHGPDLVRSLPHFLRSSSYAAHSGVQVATHELKHCVPRP